VSPLGIGRLLKGRSLTVEDLRSKVKNQDDGWEKILLSSLNQHDQELRLEAIRLSKHLPSEDVAESLMGLLREQDIDVVVAALSAIGDLRIESALSAVTGLLGRHEQQIKQEVARCLTRIGGTKGAAAIRELLDTPRLPQSSESTIRDLGVAAIPSLMSALMDGRRWVRQNAAVLLGLAADKRAVPSLMVALNDNDAGVRVAAVESLGRLGGKDAVAGLMAALEDDDERVRIQAAQALGKVGDEIAVVPLIALFTDSVRKVRDQSVKALVDIGEPSVPALVRGLNENDVRMREYCARTLSVLKSPSTFQPLIDILEDNDWSVRRYAAEALGKLNNKDAIPYLLGALEDPIDFVRERAQQGLDTLDPSGELRRRQKPVRRKKWTKYEKAPPRAKVTEKQEVGAMDMDVAEAYNVLGLGLDADRGTVRNSWRQLMRKYHPDVVRNLPDEERLNAEEEAKRVNIAYEVLMKELRE
jgi:HEAT repeat protein